MISPLTPLDFLARSALVYPETTAVVDGERRFTYREFQSRVARLAAALVRLGVKPGDRVAVLAYNGAMALEAHFGPMLIGAVLVMLNTRLQSQELDWILQHCGAKVLLIDPALRPLVESVPMEHLIDNYEELLESAAGAATPERSADLDENSC